MAEASFWLKKARGSFHGLRDSAAIRGCHKQSNYGIHRKINHHIFFDFGGLTTAQRSETESLRTIKPPI